jgi:hypothetical protein
VVEGDVLGRTLKALRTHLSLKKRGGGPSTESLSLDATIDGVERKLMVSIADYPIVFMMPLYPAPTFTAEATGTGKSVHGASVVAIKHDMKTLSERYGITGSQARPGTI